MMVDRRHLEHTLVRELERGDLDDVAHHLDYVQAADDDGEEFGVCTYAKRIEVLDAKELGLSVIDPAVVDYFNHSLFNNVYPIYNHALAETRQHPLTTRRYMWKVAY